MTLATLVTGAQVMSAMAWLMVLHHYGACLSRVVRHRLWPAVTLEYWDNAGCWAALIAIVQTLMCLRWVFIGQGDVRDMTPLSLTLWLPLYVINTACAVGVLYTWRDSRHNLASVQVADRRAVNAVIAWFALALMCIGAATWSL